MRRPGESLVERFDAEEFDDDEADGVEDRLVPDGPVVRPAVSSVSNAPVFIAPDPRTDP